MKKFELVLPCYNESKSIKTIIERAIAAAKEYGYNERDFSLVLVENGSKDDSLRIMNDLKTDKSLSAWFRVVEVKINQGYGFGLWSGLKTTGAEFVGWSHADQQCDPKDAFRALKLIGKKNSEEKVLVKGRRFGRSLKDIFVSRVLDLIATFILWKPFFEINAQPKVFDRGLLASIQSPPNDFAFDLYVLFQARKAGYKIQTIDVLFPPRIHGLSNWAFSLKSRSKTILNMIKYVWYLRRTGS